MAQRGNGLHPCPEKNPGWAVTTTEGLQAYQTAAQQ